MNTLSRRGFLTAGEAMLGYAQLPRIATAQGAASLSGARRDTVYVPPMSMVDVALDASERRWMLHCHHMPHLATGMMTEFAVSA